MCYSVMAEKNINKLTKRFGATVDDDAMERFRANQITERQMGPEGVKEIMGMSRLPSVSQFRWAPDEKDCRVYPGYFAPAIVLKEGTRVVVPMRYRVRPKHSKCEIPSKFN